MRRNQFFFSGDATKIVADSHVMCGHTVIKRDMT